MNGVSNFLQSILFGHFGKFTVCGTLDLRKYGVLFGRVLGNTGNWPGGISPGAGTLRKTHVSPVALAFAQKLK